MIVIGEERLPDQTGTAAIEINDLVVNYGRKRAVDHLNLRVAEGSVFGFLGPNGAGKTTTIKTLLGFRRPNSGNASVLGFDVAKQSLEIRARVGYVSEVNSLYDYLTIPQHMEFYRTGSPQWDQKIVEHYLKAFGLSVKAKVGQLSKGEKSQLALSLVMGNNPDLLILDEPTSGLDPVARHEFLNKLVGEIAAEGKTIFFSSHILSEVEAVADTVEMIRTGQMVVCDDLDHLKQTHKAFKLTYLTPPNSADLANLGKVPGVVNLQQEGRSVRLFVKGDLRATLHAIQEWAGALREVNQVDLNLEDIFLEYMKEIRHDR